MKPSLICSPKFAKRWKFIKSSIDLFSLGQFVFPLQTTWCSLENCSFVHLKIIYSHAQDYLKMWKEEFSRVSSQGLKWGNKLPSRKRSILPSILWIILVSLFAGYFDFSVCWILEPSQFVTCYFFHFLFDLYIFWSVIFSMVCLKMLLKSTQLKPFVHFILLV